MYFSRFVFFLFAGISVTKKTHTCEYKDFFLLPLFLRLLHYNFKAEKMSFSSKTNSTQT